jgi:hypothetical protein
MKRTVSAALACASLAGGAGAYAATTTFNSYTAIKTFLPTAAGSNTRPSPFAMGEKWTLQGSNGHSAAPVTRTVSKTFGVITNGADFPKCTASQIAYAGALRGWNAVCPKGSLIAQGPVQGEVDDPSGQPTHEPCDPYLYVYNGGARAETLFLSVYPQAPGQQYTCGQEAEGFYWCEPFTGTLSQQKGYLVETINWPPCASTDWAGAGAYVSLQRLALSYPKLTTQKSGKTVGYEESIGCLSGRRPYSTIFTAQNFTGRSPKTQSITISHKASCG